MKKLLFMLCVIPLAGCQDLQSSRPVAFAGGDGSSVDQAVLIRNAEFRETGHLAERVWLDRNYPGHQDTKESSLDLAGHHYELVELTTSTHQVAKVYFDTTDWYAK